MTSGSELGQAEAAAWRAFLEMQEALRGRMEQLLQADSGPFSADYTVLADGGRAALEAAIPGHTRHVRVMVFDQLTAEEVQHLGGISRRILAALDRDAPA